MIKRTKDGSFDGYDSGRIEELMSGEAAAETKEEHDLVWFIGFARERPWPEQWRTCSLCGVEWKAQGHPWKKGTWRYATVCSPCSDLFDAGLHPKSTRYWEGRKEVVVKEKKKGWKPYHE